MMGLLPAVTRPNGKVYQPRKLRCYPWRNEPGQGMGVIILGTHDVDAARVIATREIQYEYDPDFVATCPTIGWWRLAIRKSEYAWIDDAACGAAGVMFTAKESGDADE